MREKKEDIRNSKGKFQVL